MTYAALPDGWAPGGADPSPADGPPVDRWILSRCDGTDGRGHRAAWRRTTRPAQAGSRRSSTTCRNWYVRVSRRRFWGGRHGDAVADADHRAAFATLHECLSTLALLIAPFCPFVAEELYGNLVAAHDPARSPACTWPTGRSRRGGDDPDLEAAMAAARDAVAVGRGARSEAKIKVRQPLAQAVIACPPGAAADVGGLGDLIADELNVHDVRFVTDPGELVAVTIKPNYRTLGPRFGKAMPALAAAVAEPPGAETARGSTPGSPSGRGRRGPRELGPRICCGRRDRPRGTPSARIAAWRSASRPRSPRICAEGLAREIVHAVQNARRAAGLRVEERIVLHLDGSGPVREAIDAYRATIARRDARGATHRRSRGALRRAPPRGAGHRRRAGRPAPSDRAPGDAPDGPRLVGAHAAAPGGAAGAEHHVVVGAEARPDPVRVEVERSMMPVRGGGSRAARRCARRRSRRRP